MPNACAVKNCPNRKTQTKYDPEIVYHKFPRNETRLRRWIAFCRHGPDWKPLSHQAVCSKHFDDISYDERFQDRRTLKPFAIPKIKYARDDKNEELSICRVCQVASRGSTKQLLHHAVDGKSYKEIIQESLNIYIDQDDASNVLLCEDCCYFIEQLNLFVYQCQATFSKLDTSVPLPDELTTDDAEEDWLDYDELLLQEIESELLRDAGKDSRSTRIITEEITYNIAKVPERTAESTPVAPAVSTEPETVKKKRPPKKPKAPKPPRVKKPPVPAEPPPVFIYDPVNCTVCGFSFNNKDHLQTHMNLHTKEVEYPCQYCGKIFYLHQTLMNHEKTHLKQLYQVDHKCTECGVVYSNKRYLEMHYKQKHLDLCTFSCKQCDYITYRNVRLVSHVRTMHSYQKPYVCTVCGFASSDDHGHFRHYQQHRKKGEANKYDIWCTYCNRIFLDEDAFEEHLEKEHPEQAAVV